MSSDPCLTSICFAECRIPEGLADGDSDFRNSVLFRLRILPRLRSGDIAATAQTCEEHMRDMGWTYDEETNSFADKAIEDLENGLDYKYKVMASQDMQIAIVHSKMQILGFPSHKVPWDCLEQAGMDAYARAFVNWKGLSLTSENTERVYAIVKRAADRELLLAEIRADEEDETMLAINYISERGEEICVNRDLQHELTRQFLSNSIIVETTRHVINATAEEAEFANSKCKRFSEELDEQRHFLEGIKKDVKDAEKEEAELRQTILDTQLAFAKKDLTRLIVARRRELKRVRKLARCQKTALLELDNIESENAAILGSLEDLDAHRQRLISEITLSD
ncbi:MAG: hypothetical protein M1819_004325 [Sarea resinae]|nr:MAG: hypothetical protein M1819_004325 [Sarea resinae]